MDALRKLMSLIRRRKKTFVACAVVAALLAGSAVWRIRDRKAGGPIGETATVTRGALDISVEAKGQVEASDTVNIFPQLYWGRARLTFVIQDGAEVKKGDVLAKFDTEQIDTKLKEVSLEVERQRNELIKAEERLRMAKAQAETQLADAKLKLELAKMAVEQYGTVALTADGSIDEAAYADGKGPTKGEAYQGYRSASLQIDKAKTTLERAQSDAKGMDVLQAKGFATKVEYVSSQLAVVEAERGLESAQLSYELLNKYSHPQKIGGLNQSLTEAQNNLKKIELTNSVDISSAETNVRVAKASFKDRADWQEELKKLLAMCVITSPVDGKVLLGDGNPWWKEMIAVGRDVWRGYRLFTIPNTSSIIGRVRVLEIDAYQVKPGQAVRVTLDALPGVTLPGKISKVAEYASSQGWRWGGGYNSKVFDVELKFDAADERLKPGMSCTAEVLLDSIADTTYVPVLAVFNKDGKQICYVVDGQKSVPVTVRTGKASEKFVEILDGLTPGQKVLLAESEASNKGAGKGGA